MTESVGDFDTVPYCDSNIICCLDFSSMDLWHKTQSNLSLCKPQRLTEHELKKWNPNLMFSDGCFKHTDLDETLLVLATAKPFNN